MVSQMNNNYKVLWLYNGLVENVPEMYDRPKQLCKWFMKMHKLDSQYARGKFLLVSMIYEKTS